MSSLETLNASYAWKFEGDWSQPEVDHLQSAAGLIEAYLAAAGHADPAAWMRKYLNAVFLHVGLFGHISPLAGKSFVFPKNQVRLVEDFATVYHADKHVVHELGHVLDNQLGPILPATFFGNGAADAMLKAVGGTPEKYTPRFIPRNDYIEACTPAEYWSPRSSYGNTCCAEDFAETFVHTICDPARVPPRRRAWMQAFLQHLQ